jgi:rhodanese-related sulfurtransferase
MTSTDPIVQIDSSSARDLAGNGALLLDVREPEEWRVGRIADVVHTPLGDLRPESVPRDRVVVAVRRSGNRSGTAAIQLAAAAGVDVRNMAGGMKAWAEAGLPITTDDGAPGTVG